MKRKKTAGQTSIRMARRLWTGLIGLARRKRCSGIHVEAVDSMCDSRANINKKKKKKKKNFFFGFVGYGDADPSNVSSLVHGTEMRVAETRAVNRALRKAYGIGICSVHYRTKGKAFGSLFIENPPRSSTTPSATALRGRGDALTALKLKTSFEQ